MLNKEIADRFLGSLVNTLNKTSLYQPNHPLFTKAAEDFRQALVSTFAVIEPIVIGITIDSFIIEDETFTSPAYRDLAKRLHLYRIKKLEITKGITSEELSFFFSKLSISLKEVFKAGGMANILNKGVMTHLIIHKLDYSELLTKDVGEYKEIWPFLLEEAVATDDDAKVIKLVQDFGRMIGFFTVNELLDNAQILENIRIFISYLRDKDKEKFLYCAKEIVQHVFKSKELPEEELNKIRILVEGLSESVFAEILSSRIFDVDRLENFNLDLFSRVIGTERLPTVVSLTIKNIHDNFFGNKEKLKYKIEHILNSLTDLKLSQIYRNAFTPLLNTLASAPGVSFDHKSIKVNYRSIILHLLLHTANQQTLDIIAKEITGELGMMNRAVDFEYLGLLIGALKKRQAAIPAEAEPAFQEIAGLITTTVEKNLWEAPPGDLDDLIDYPQSSVMGIAFYLDKMLAEGKINSPGLKLFLRLFPQGLNPFYDYLSKRQDIELAEKIISVLKTIDIDLALPILERIYSFCNTYIKIEILRAMGELGSYRKEFFIDVLLNGEIPLKQEVLLTLIKDENKKKEILEKFFSVDDPWRVNTKTLLDNIRLIERLDLKYTKVYLLELNKKLFFWHWGVKREIKRILNKWE
jgi:hypothetical protein